jgi:hypothetical protein
MKLKLLDKLGDGAFADVWRAKDELGREVAVKIVRPANVGVADALAHAKALARATHPNVVSVFTLERIVDPDGTGRVDCVVMELVHGETLAETLRRVKLTRAQAESIGLGIIRGLSHIHAQGMAHGDLHEENVMISNGSAKIIDILYLNSLASISTETRSKRLRKDLLSLRIILQRLIIHSELDSAEATEFNNLLESESSLEDIEEAFCQILSVENTESHERAVDHAYARLSEDEFVAGEEYAEALANETPGPVILPVLKRLVANDAFTYRHGDYVRQVWSRLPPSAQAELLHDLGAKLDTELPKGKWPPSIRLLKLLGRDGWDGLTTRLRIKVETLIVKDVLAGHKDIHSARAVSGGALGTYALSLWRRFAKPEVLANNLISLLEQNWYTQNYVGEFFLRQIPALARKTSKRAEFIAAIKVAIRNDARLVKRNIEHLPIDWLEELGFESDE